MYDIGRRHVRFGLVIVVIADEILDGVLGKEAPEFLIELGGEGLVVDHHQRRPIDAGDGLRHREGLARSGDAKQHLMLVAAIETFRQLADRASLVAGQREIGHQVEAVVNRRHTNWQSYYT